MTVIVIGSANQDYIVQLEHAPALGETVLAKSLRKQPGGKGANQAVAASRVGAEVVFVGCVGDDDDGALVLRQLRSEGVDTSEVEVVGSQPTGLALVYVFEDGENSIAVIPGANGAVPASRAARVIRRLAGPNTVVVTQGEVSHEVIEAAISTARSTGARPILNLAPYSVVERDVLALCDPLVVNENEASALLGTRVDDLGSAKLAAASLARLTRSVVITIGSAGAVWAEGDALGHVPVPVVDAVVDSTGAGDAFVGALSTLLSEGATLPRAVEVGVRAGSFAVTRLGAQSSYPMREDIGFSVDEGRERVNRRYTMPVAQE
jgi:ribokinase